MQAVVDYHPEDAAIRHFMEGQLSPRGFRRDCTVRVVDEN